MSFGTRVLWIEDQYLDLADYETPLYDLGYIVEEVDSVSAAIHALQEGDYAAVVCDVKINPGDHPAWRNLDEARRRSNPYVDPYLGLELLLAIFAPGRAEVTLDPPITLDPKRVLVFSVVDPGHIRSKLKEAGAPELQILPKSTSTTSSLADFVQEVDS